MASSNAQRNPAGDFFKAFSDFKSPVMDFNGIFAVQRRNFEAFSAANQILTESLQAFSRRQLDILRGNIEESLKVCKDTLSSGSPETNTAKQVSFVKNSLEKSLANLREAAEMMSKSSSDVFEVLNKRVVESLDEFGKITSPKQ